MTPEAAMDPLQARTEGQPSLDRVVLISNSVPKSGSSLLFNLQRELVKGISGRPIDYSPLEKAGIKVQGGYIDADQMSRLAKFLREDGTRTGPLVLKMHMVLSDALLEVFSTRDDVFVSTIIRDPVDVFLSARRNFHRTGEFRQFAEVESGINVVNGYFRKIYEASVKAGQTKELPIVRYEDLMKDRFGTVIQSLPQALKAIIWRAVFQKFLDEAKAEKTAEHRRSGAQDTPGASNEDKALQARIEPDLAEMRERLGYA